MQIDLIRLLFATRLGKKILNISGRNLKQLIIFYDIDKIYNDSLNFSGIIRPWALIEGKYRALELRYMFVNDYLNIAGFNYKKTSYYKFIKEYSSLENLEFYEGNKVWAYSDADNICKRFINLTDSVINNIDIYNKMNRKNYIDLLSSIYDSIITFEKDNMVKIRYISDNKQAIRKESKQYDENAWKLKNSITNRIVGHLIPTGVYIDKKLIILNGSHRLAIFKALKENNIYSNKFPVIIK